MTGEKFAYIPYNLHPLMDQHLHLLCISSSAMVIFLFEYEPLQLLLPTRLYIAKLKILRHSYVEILKWRATMFGVMSRQFFRSQVRCDRELISTSLPLASFITSPFHFCFHALLPRKRGTTHSKALFYTLHRTRFIRMHPANILKKMSNKV